MKKTSVLVAALVMCSIPCIPVGAAATTSALPFDCDSNERIEAHSIPSELPVIPGCSLVGRIIEHRGVAVEVPPPGMGLVAIGFGSAGTDSLTVSSLSDGTVLVDSSGADLAGEPELFSRRESPDPCAPAVASAYAFLGHKAYSPVRWYYNGAGAPENVAGDASAHIVQGATNVADGRNDCGIAQVPLGSFHVFAGPTSTAPNTVNGDCRAADGVSVVGWGPALDKEAAFTCLSFTTDESPRRLLSADIVIDGTTRWTTEPSTCREYYIGSPTPFLALPNITFDPEPEVTYDLQSVATHEWAHVFGLGHIPETDITRSQTMTEYAENCTDNHRTLGRGDLNGMLSLYGSL